MTEIEEAVARVETLFLQAHDALEVAREHVRIAENTEAARVYYEVNAALYAVRGRPDLLSALTASQAEVERLRAFALAYRRKMEVGIAGMTDEEIQTLRLAWDYATAALEATDDK